MKALSAPHVSTPKRKKYESAPQRAGQGKACHGVSASPHPPKSGAREKSHRAISPSPKSRQPKALRGVQPPKKAASWLYGIKLASISITPAILTPCVWVCMAQSVRTHKSIGYGVRIYSHRHSESIYNRRRRSPVGLSFSSS